jgi:hypothetical protein
VGPAWRGSARSAPGSAWSAGLELAHEALTQLEDRVDADGTPWRAERALDATITSVSGWLGGQVSARPRHGGRRRASRGAAGRRPRSPHARGQRSRRGRRGRAAADRGVAPRSVYSSRPPPVAGCVRPRPGPSPGDRRARARTPRPTTAATPRSPPPTRVELGGQWRNAHLALAATGFATWIERESLFDHVSGVNALRDGSRRLGVEVAIEAAPWPGLRLRGDVTAVDARYVVTDNPVPGAPRLLASGELRWEHGPWSAGVAGRFLGPRPLSHGATAAAAAVVDGLAGVATRSLAGRAAARQPDRHRLERGRVPLRLALGSRAARERAAPRPHLTWTSVRRPPRGRAHAVAAHGVTMSCTLLRLATILAAALAACGGSEEAATIQLPVTTTRGPAARAHHRPRLHDHVDLGARRDRRRAVHDRRRTARRGPHRPAAPRPQRRRRGHRRAARALHPALGRRGPRPPSGSRP